MSLRLKASFPIYLISALISLIISFITYFKIAVINPDGICYLKSAESLPKGYAYMTHLCDQAYRPFYSILIFLVHQLSHLSYFYSSFLLNSFFSLVSVCLFIAIIATIHQQKRLMLLASLVILASHSFNALRPEIIRDHGYWTFYLLSIFALLHYFRSTIGSFASWMWAFFWGSALMVAALFRIEGSIFLLLIPFVALMYPISISKRLYAFIQLNSLFLFALVSLYFIFLLMPKFNLFHYVQSSLMHRLHELKMLKTIFFNTVSALNIHVLSVYAKSDAPFILVMLFFVWYVFLTITTLTLLYTLFFIYAVMKKLCPHKAMTTKIIWGYIIVNVFVTGLFLEQNLFLSKRYLIALCLTLMIFIPFALENLLIKYKNKRNVLYIIIGLLIINTLGGLVSFGYSKSYIKEAANWSAKMIPKNAKLYSNDIVYLYYTNHDGDHLFQKIKKTNNQTYDYIALKYDAHDNTNTPLLLKQSSVQLIKKFSNKRQDAIAIYKVKK